MVSLQIYNHSLHLSCNDKNQEPYQESSSSGCTRVVMLYLGTTAILYSSGCVSVRTDKAYQTDWTPI